MQLKEEVVLTVIDNLRRIFQAINENSKSAVRETGLTTSQLWALHVMDNSFPIMVSELARQMYQRPANVAGILDRMEAKGLVQRTRSKVDHRVVYLDLSEYGKKVVTNAPEVAQAVLAKGLGTLSDGQLTRVVDGMRHIVRILEAE